MKGLFIPEITAEMFRNGCLEGIEALMAEGEIYDIDYTGWIQCSERLPEAGKYVLRTIRKFGWHGEEYWSVDIGPYNTNDGSIIAWMPLPEPYKGEEL